MLKRPGKGEPEIEFTDYLGLDEGIQENLAMARRSERYKNAPKEIKKVFERCADAVGEFNIIHDKYMAAFRRYKILLFNLCKDLNHRVDEKWFGIVEKQVKEYDEDTEERIEINEEGKEKLNEVLENYGRLEKEYLGVCEEVKEAFKEFYKYFPKDDIE